MCSISALVIVCPAFLPNLRSTAARRFESGIVTSTGDAAVTVNTSGADARPEASVAVTVTSAVPGAAARSVNRPFARAAATTAGSADEAE